MGISPSRNEGETRRPDWIICPEDELLYARALEDNLTEEECEDRDYVVEHFRIKSMDPPTPPPSSSQPYIQVHVGDIIEVEREPHNPVEFGCVTQVNGASVTFTDIRTHEIQYVHANKIRRRFDSSLNQDLWNPINSMLGIISQVHANEMKETARLAQEQAEKEAIILQSCLDDFLENGRPVVHRGNPTQPFLRVPVPLYAWQPHVVEIFRNKGIDISEAPVVELPIVGHCVRTKYFMLVFLKKYLDDEYELPSRDVTDSQSTIKTSRHSGTKI